MTYDLTDATATKAALGAGAALLDGDGVAWALLVDTKDRPVSSMLGGALAWALRNAAVSLRLIVDSDSSTGVLRRRADWFDWPITVSRLSGRDLVAVDPEPLAPSAVVPASHLAMVGQIVAGGAVPVEEHGVLSGEVNGLEVCRVIDDPVSGEVRLEVGIGAHDRETFQLLHGDRPTVEALAGVVATVAAQRVPGMPPHPLNQLAASRLIRARLLAEPALIGASALTVVQPPIARLSLKSQQPCAAFDADQQRLIVCTSGVDLDVVPWAGDAIAMHHVVGCTIVAPARDILDIQQRLAALLVVPTSFHPL